MAAALIGTGEADTPSGRMPAAQALAAAGLEPLTLGPKEGLALLNGTQFSTAHALAALFETGLLYQSALVTDALSTEAVKESDTLFDHRIHAWRKHRGQIESADALRSLMAGSAIRQSHLENDERVQDPYCLRCQQSRIDMRLRTRYVDLQADDLDHALVILGDAKQTGKAISVALLGNAAAILPEMVRRGMRHDAVTNQTSAHDPSHGYLPVGWSVGQWRAMQERDPAAVDRAVRESIATHAMLDLHAMGIPTVDYGNNIQQMSFEEGVENAFDFPGFVPAYIRPLFCRGVGPFRWVALSGDPENIYKTDAKVKELIPDDPHLHQWLDMARDRIQFQGLPARICWVGLGDLDRLGRQSARVRTVDSAS